MRVKIRGGTPSKHTDNLCLSCAFSSVRRNDKNDTTIQCSAFERQIVTNTTECSVYREVQKTSLREMQNMAWIISPSEIKGKIGFKPFKEMSDEEKADVKSDTGEW